MYTAILIVLFAIAGILIFKGLRAGRPLLFTGGVAVVAFSIAFFWFMDFWGELLWFEALGYESRYLIEIGYKAGFTLIGALAGALLVYLVTFKIPRDRGIARLSSLALAAIIGGQWSMRNWDVILRFRNAVTTGMTDPVLGRDTGFYLFKLPFYNDLYHVLLLLSIVAVVTAFVASYVRFQGQEIGFGYAAGGSRSNTAGMFHPMYTSAAALLLVLAWGKYLDRFNLMYSTWGFVSGPGWTDVHVRLPAYVIMIVISVLLGILLFVPSLRNVAQRITGRTSMPDEISHVVLVSAAGVVLLASWLIALNIVPGLFQWLVVEPNEITFENPYIANNIEFTRFGFNLHNLEEREYPATNELSDTMIQENSNIINNLRLWDYRALDAVFQQFQAIRLYYEFDDVDIDRYMIDGKYRQVMVSAREMQQNNLSPQSQTFVNRQFKYTHGYGITLTTVNEFTPQGLPHLLIRDIPPVSEFPELQVTRPRIYYGALSREYVIVNSKEQEFDYPSGDENVYNRYDGPGGVQISSVWRKFLFGWKFGGTKLFLSSYPTAESRIMFHRDIRNRVETLAPFLKFDKDPYIVLADGKLYWMIDAYTTSEYFPYSEPFQSHEVIQYSEGDRARALSGNVSTSLANANYVRNSVKVVLDASTGKVNMYVFTPDDPIIQVWSRIFPGLFKSRDAMPADLESHVRYPEDLLLAQGLVYAKYHMTDPNVFFNQEDLWVRATEKYYSAVQPVEPYYVMWEQPDTDKQEFILMLPFTPKNRQVLIGWIAGMCDGDDYGRFLAYKFPKDKRVLGTQQMETKIDQDSFLAGQLTLWDQRGSSVVRGNVLVLPLSGTLLYVEPIYLQSETAAYPELRLVAVMHNDDLSYAETFDEALRGLLTGETVTNTVGQLVDQAGKAFESYLKLSGESDFQGAAKALEELRDTLQSLMAQTGENPVSQ